MAVSRTVNWRGRKGGGKKRRVEDAIDDRQLLLLSFSGEKGKEKEGACCSWHIVSPLRYCLPLKKEREKKRKERGTKAVPASLSPFLGEKR